jgi:hypothetical protein
MKVFSLKTKIFHYVFVGLSFNILRLRNLRNIFEKKMENTLKNGEHT